MKNIVPSEHTLFKYFFQKWDDIVPLASINNYSRLFLLGTDPSIRKKKKGKRKEEKKLRNENTRQSYPSRCTNESS